MPELAYDLHHDTTDASWPGQGFWTWDDYLRLPADGQRYEIIHGVLYVSPAPRLLHQFVTTRLTELLSAFVRQRHLGVVLTAPVDVLLPSVASPVQPDILFLGRDNLPDFEQEQSFQGVPDLVVEVLSRSTQRIDREVKLKAYEEAKVKEYWIVDPKLRTVALYVLDDARGEYRESERFAADEIVRSTVLEAFTLKVSELFP
jgi:Uma2 family endonuclease